MKTRQLLILVSFLLASLTNSIVSAQATQYFPALTYRTGAYGTNGAPWANGYIDYLKLVNARGGMNGVQITYDECEFGYATDRGVECYERLKTNAPNGAIYQPLSTGVTFALTDKAPVDKSVILTAGYGRSESADGIVFKWNFPLLGTYWTGADIIMQVITKREADNLKGKKIALIYHDSPFGKEPIALLQERARIQGFELILLPVAHPGVEQKSTWLQVRQQRPDYVLLWGWGVMNSAALKEAAATGYPRDKMYGVWWAAAEQDVKDVKDIAKGYHGLIPIGYSAPILNEIKKTLHAKNNGTGPVTEVGQVLYNRGMISAVLAVEGVMQAQTKFGKGKVMTGEQIRWGLENLNINEARIKALGLTGMIRPVRTTCQDHEGSRSARIHTWNGKAWEYATDWIEAEQRYILPLVKSFADKYATDKNITRRTAVDC